MNRTGFLMSRKYKDFDDYLFDQPERNQIFLQELRDIILEAIPDATPVMFYNSPGFKPVGLPKGEHPIIIGGFKKHVGLYPHPNTIEEFKEDLTPFKTSEGTVQFQVDQPLPKSLILKMIRFRHEMILQA